MNEDEYGTKEAPVSLSGNLDMFPLEEVLRLLSRSRQTGRLRVDGPGAGSVYMEEGSITFAAEDPDETFRRVLVGAGVVTPDDLDQLGHSKSSLTEILAPDVSSSTFDDLVREQCVESLYRIRKPGHGPFTFSVDVKPRYVTGLRYDIEVVVSEADRRAAEWTEVEAVVPDLSTPWRMVRQLDEESVTIGEAAWRFLAGLEGSASVDTVAERLGLTAFQAARRMAELARAHLVEEVPVPATPEVPAYTTYDSPAEPVFGAVPTAEPDTEPEPEQPVDRSWWEEETPSFEPTFGEAPTDEADSAHEPEGSDVESGDDTFLEGVFGGLSEEAPADGADAAEAGDESENADEEEDEHGFGLLRRRGLGAAFRELADS